MIKQLNFHLIILGLVISIASTVHADYCFSSLDVPGATETYAPGINNAGNVVGFYYTTTGDFGFLYAGGNFTFIRVGPDTTATSATGINDTGNIVGFYGDLKGANEGFLYSGGNFTPINVPGAIYTEALGINDVGNIVGFYGDTMRTYHGFLYTKGGFTSIDFPGATETYACGINHSGNVVGFYADAKGSTHGFLDTGGNLIAIDVPGATLTEALGINDPGDIVGYYVDAKGVNHGFFSTKGGFTSVDFPGATETWGSGINASGNIVGYYADATGLTHGFIATFFNTTLTVSKSGTGNGIVTGTPAGIDCGSNCTACYNTGGIIALSATPDAGSVFTGWSGPCSGTGTCTVTMSADETVTATFTASAPNQYALTVVKSGTGTGTVASSPPGITCGNDCSETYSNTQKVQLMAQANSNSSFTGWSGGCSGTGSCQVTVSGLETVVAKFTLNVPNISVSPITIQYGAIKLGKEATKTLKITNSTSTTNNQTITKNAKNTNNGLADLVITLSGLEGTDFSIQGSSSITIKAKKNYNLNIVFAPKSTGPETAILKISSNDSNIPEVYVPLSGTGQ